MLTQSFSLLYFFLLLDYWVHLFLVWEDRRAVFFDPRLLRVARLVYSVVLPLQVVQRARLVAEQSRSELLEHHNYGNKHCLE